MPCKIGCEIHNRRLRNFVDFLKTYRRTLYAVILPIILLPLIFLLDSLPTRCTFMVSLMLGYGLPQAIPQTAVSLIPQFLMPVMGIMDSEKSANCYFFEQNMLNVGVFMIAIALENSKLNRRIALRILMATDCNLRKLHVLFVCATALFSMFFANVATLILVLSVMRTVLRQLDKEGLFPLFLVNPEDEGLTLEELREMDEVDASGTTTCFYLSVGYAATIGGIGCFTGTATNKVLVRSLDKYFPRNPIRVNFQSWFKMGFPLMLILIVLLVVYMQVCYLGLFRPRSRISRAIYIHPDDLDFVQENLHRKRAEMGKVKFAEYVTILAILVAMLLSFLKSLYFVQNWLRFAQDLFIGDSTIAIFISLVLFGMPSLEQTLGVIAPRRNLLPPITWEDVQKRGRWDIILITGGSHAMAQGTQVSGLIKALTDFSMFFMKGQTKTYCVSMTLLTSVGITAVVNNEAACEFLLPILADFCVREQFEPVFLMFGACLGASMSFCFEVGTPVNAIVVRDGKIPDWHLFGCGIGMTVLAAAVLIGLYPVFFNLIF